MISADFPYEKQRLRVLGRKMAFVEQVLPSGMQRSLAEEEMDRYRLPFMRPARLAGQP